MGTPAAEKDFTPLEKIDRLLNVPFDGDFTRVNGQLRWRIDLAGRVTIREQILALFREYQEANKNAPNK